MGSINKALNIGALIVVLGMVAVIFKSKETQGIIKNFGTLFANSIAAAEKG